LDKSICQLVKNRKPKTGLWVNIIIYGTLNTCKGGKI